MLKESVKKVTLENIREGLLQEARSEEKRLLKEAEKEAAAILNGARENAKRIKDEARQNAESAVEAEGKERLGAAKLKANKTVGEARNRLVEKSIGEIWKEFSGIPGQRGYDEFMKKIIREAEKELGSGCTVSVNPRDLKIAKKHSKSRAEKAPGIAGGAVMASKDGVVSIDASLESIFENNREEIRGMVFRELFK